MSHPKPRARCPRCMAEVIAEQLSSHANSAACTVERTKRMYEWKGWQRVEMYYVPWLVEFAIPHDIAPAAVQEFFPDQRGGKKKAVVKDGLYVPSWAARVVMLARTHNTRAPHVPAPVRKRLLRALAATTCANERAARVLQLESVVTLGGGGAQVAALVKRWEDESAKQALAAV